jgi:hypothetical protein
MQNVSWRNEPPDGNLARMREITLLIIGTIWMSCCALEHITVLHYGEVIADGTRIIKKDQVVEAYWAHRAKCSSHQHHTYYGDSHVLQGVSLDGAGQVDLAWT